jgi:hypothetical protein
MAEVIDVGGVFFLAEMYSMVVFVIKQLRDLCIPRAQYSKVQTANNNPMISQSMRYSQIMNATNLRGHRRTVVGLDKIPLELRPRPSIIVPLANFS